MRPETTMNEKMEYKKDLYKQEVYLQKEMVFHKRSTYDLIGVLGDMGGISGLLASLMYFLFAPISTHSFIVKSAQKLFIARSEKPGLFVEMPEDKRGKNFDEKMIDS